MPRYRLLVEYDGRPYRGFQAQERLPSIQGAIEKAVLGFSGQKIRLIGAGRTDTGVHATGQVIHMDLEQDWRPAVVRDAHAIRLAVAHAHAMRRRVESVVGHARMMLWRDQKSERGIGRVACAAS